MRALLLKDVRLAMDMLLPWGLIVAGFVVAMLVLVALPVDLRPDFAARFGVVDVLTFTLTVVGLTAFPAAAWAAVCVVGGEERHGARLLGLALPVAPVVRAFSKHVAIAVAGLAPAIAVLLAALLTRLLPGAYSIAPPEVVTVGLLAGGACAVAAWLGLFVASFVRGAFSAVLVAMLCGGAAALLGLLGMRLAVVWIERHYRGLDGAEEVVRIAWSACAAPAGAVSVAAAALVALVWGTAALLAPLRPMTRVAFAPVAVTAALIAGAIAAQATLPRTIELRRSGLAAMATARALDDEALATEVRRLGAAYRAAALEPESAWVALLSQRDWRLLVEARTRASHLPLDAMDRSPLVLALRGAMSTSSRRLANESAIFAVPRDPVSLATMLEAVRMYPDDMYLKLRVVDQASTVTGLPRALDLPAGRVDAAEQSRSIDAALRPLLERLLEGTFPDKELVRAVLKTLQASPSR